MEMWKSDSEQKEGWKKWFRRDNLLIIILSGVLLFIIALPAEEKAGGQSDQNSNEQVQNTGASGNAGAETMAISQDEHERPGGAIGESID